MDPIWAPTFTPDGARLIGVGNGKGVHVWDLRLIRRHLAEMGLDWDAPPYPPIDSPSPLAPRIAVDMRLGDPVPLAQWSEGRD